MSSKVTAAKKSEVRRAPATTKVTTESEPVKPAVTAQAKPVETKAKVSSAKAKPVEAKPAVKAAEPLAPVEEKVEPKTTKAKSKVALKSTAAAKPAVEAETKATENDEGEKVQVKPKKKRQRPKIRSFGEIFESIQSDIDASYKRLQAAHRQLKSLEAAHNREVHNTKSRESSARTPTIVFDQDLINYFKLRLDPNELVVRHKEGSDESKTAVNLAELTTETRVHRTDVTQLYNAVFKKYKMQDPEDGRNILYQSDAELVRLLTTGEYDAKLEPEVAQVRDGTFRLTIFNIQRFTNHHLGRVEPPPKAKPVETDAEASADAE